MAKRIAGKLFVNVNGTRLSARGNFTWNLGRDKREPIVGCDDVHGFKEMPQAPYFEGEISLTADLDVDELLTARDATCTLELANGWTLVFRDAFFSAEGVGETEDGKMGIRFDALSADRSRQAA
jgi:hypothetical protein